MTETWRQRLFSHDTSHGVADQPPVAPYIPDVSRDSQIADYLVKADNLNHARKRLRRPAHLVFGSGVVGTGLTIGTLIATGATGVGLPIALVGGGLYLSSVVARGALLHAEKQNKKKAVAEAKKTEKAPSELAAFTRLMKDSDEKASRGALGALLAGGVAFEGVAIANHAAVAAGYHSAEQALAHSAAVKLGILTKAGAISKAGAIGIGAGKAAGLKLGFGGLAKASLLKIGIFAGHAVPWVLGAYILKKGIVDPSEQRAVARKAAYALAKEQYATDHSPRTRRL